MHSWSRLRLSFALFAETQVRPEDREAFAQLILPDPDFEARLDLRKILFGLNCDPFHVQ